MSTVANVPDYPGDQGDENQESAPEQDPFSPAVRYAGPDVTCSNCGYFDGQSQCSNQKKIADGGPTVDAGGRCEEFEAAGQQQPDALAQSLAATKPFGAGAGMSNS